MSLLDRLLGIRLVQDSGADETFYQTLNFGTGFVVTEDAANERLTVTATAATGGEIPVGHVAPVRLVTTQNDTLNGLAARNGVTPVAGDRVLVPAQTAATENGIYIAAVGAWSRATDFDEDAEVVSMTLVPVEEGGTAYDDGTVFALVSPNPVTVGVTALTFDQITTSLAGTEGQFLAIDQNGVAKLTNTLTFADLAQNSAVAIWLRNRTAATALEEQQFSPGIMFTGHNWSGSASERHDWFLLVESQGSTAPGASELVVVHDLDTAGAQEYFRFGRREAGAVVYNYAAFGQNARDNTNGGLLRLDYDADPNGALITYTANVGGDSYALIYTHGILEAMTFGDDAAITAINGSPVKIGVAGTEVARFTSTLASFTTLGVTTTGYVGVGSALPTTGGLRVANAVGFYSRTVGGTDVRIASVDASGNILFGGDAGDNGLHLRSGTSVCAYVGGVRQLLIDTVGADFEDNTITTTGVIRAGAGTTSFPGLSFSGYTGHGFSATAATVVASVSSTNVGWWTASSWNFNVPTLRWAAAVTAPSVSQAAAGDALGETLSVLAQGNASATLKAGKLLLGSGYNSLAGGHGAVEIWRGGASGTRVANFAGASSDFIALGADVSTQGTLRTGNDTHWWGRQSGAGSDYHLIGIGSTNSVEISNSGRPIVLSGTVTMNVATFRWASSASSPVITQLAAGAATGNDLSVTAQGNASASLLAGDLLLGGGTNTTDATKSGNIALGALPVGWGAMAAGVFVVNASAAPSSNPTAGGFLYAEGGALKWRGSSGTVTTIAAA